VGFYDATHPSIVGNRNEGFDGIGPCRFTIQ
jgi:hypothetical protein